MNTILWAVALIILQAVIAALAKRAQEKRKLEMQSKGQQPRPPASPTTGVDGPRPVVRASDAQGVSSGGTLPPPPPPGEPSMPVFPQTRADLSQARAQADAQYRARALAKDQAQARARGQSQAQAQAQAQARARAQSQAQAQARARAEAQAIAQRKAQAEAKAQAQARAQARAQAGAQAGAQARAQAGAQQSVQRGSVKPRFATQPSALQRASDRAGGEATAALHSRERVQESLSRVKAAERKVADALPGDPRAGGGARTGSAGGVNPLAGRIRGLLADRSKVRDAFVLSEILGAPRGATLGVDTPFAGR